MKRIDVVVVGASLAGAACVRELNRRGVEAVALDRAVFPAEKVCGGFLSPGAVAVLDEMDLLAHVRNAGAVQIHQLCVRAGDRDALLDLPTPGLSISRRTLDAIVSSGVPRKQLCVEKIVPGEDGFRVQAGAENIDARVVVDASGKLSRFSRRRPAGHFGVQFYAPPRSAGRDSAILDFWFFRDGYGGVASIEDGRSNACFLIRRDALHRYMNRDACRVTGPLTYVRQRAHLISVGDAAGMIDPFCGEGMRHALDSGRMAAHAIAAGLSRKDSYEAMLAGYTASWTSQWAGRRRLAASVRGVLGFPGIVQRGLQAGAARLITSFWK
jgi:flavin-dependent dehydrogenase